jgi:5'-nucleotidase
VQVLITNDDGIDSPGLVALARAACDAGHEVVVAAPSREFSGASAALTAVEQDGRIVVESRELPGLPGVPAFAVAASPAFIVLIALSGGLGDSLDGGSPDMVLSGINYGANAGRAVTHSGTVGAALTAALGGLRAAAFSVGHSVRRPATEPRWDTPTLVATQLMPVIEEMPTGIVLNVNVPDVPYEQLRGIKRTPLATFGAVQFIVAERTEGYLRMALEDNEADLEVDTDEYWLSRNHVTVTPIRPAGEVVDIDVPLADLTEYAGP